MDEELKEKILKYADTAYAAEHHTSLQQTTEKIAATKNQLAARGVILSGATVVAVAQLHGEHINRCVQARVDALLDGYEIHGAEIDGFILIEATALRSRMIEEISANPTSAGLPPGCPFFELFKPELVKNTGAIINRITAQIERRKVVPKLTPPGSVQNVYHLHGHNSRVNIQSTDRSTNVVNLSSQEIFAQLRQQVSEKIDGESKEEILKSLDELEEAQNTPGFASRYTKFISVAADHLTLISPFIPALTELLQKSLGG